MDINQLMKQAQQMSKKLEDANNQIALKEFEGEASNGLVKVVVNGDHKVLNVDIDESIINKDDKDMIQDLIMIACNDAIDKANEYKKEKLGSMASAMGLPNL